MKWSKTPPLPASASSYSRTRLLMVVAFMAWTSMNSSLAVPRFTQIVNGTDG